MAWQNFSRKSLWLLLKNMVVCSCGTQPYFLTLTLAFPKKQLCVVLYRVHWTRVYLTLILILSRQDYISVHIKFQCTLGAWQNFLSKKTRVGARRLGFLRNPNLLTPTLFFFLTNKFCTVLSCVYWARVSKYFFKFDFV